MNYTAMQQQMQKWGRIAILVRFSLIPNLHELLTFGDVTNILICIIISEYLGYMQTNILSGILFLCDSQFLRYSDFNFQYPEILVPVEHRWGVDYDVIYSVIAGLPKVYPDFFDVPHGIL